MTGKDKEEQPAIETTTYRDLNGEIASASVEKPADAAADRPSGDSTAAPADRLKPPAPYALPSIEQPGPTLLGKRRTPEADKAGTDDSCSCGADLSANEDLEHMRPRLRAIRSLPPAGTEAGRRNGHPAFVGPIQGPTRLPDRIEFGGMMRCCIKTIDDMYPDGPDCLATEDQRVQCEYSDLPNHRMIFQGGAWRWDTNSQR